MFVLLLVLLIVFIATDAFIAAAVIWHLHKYTLPGWTAAKAVVPAYLGLSLTLLALALYSFLRIPWSAYPF